MHLHVAMLLLCLVTVVSSTSVGDAATHFGRHAGNRPDDVATVPNGQQLEAQLSNITDFRLDRLSMRPPGRHCALSVANDASAVYVPRALRSSQSYQSFQSLGQHNLL